MTYAPTEPPVWPAPRGRVPTALKLLGIGTISAAVLTAGIWAAGGFEEHLAITNAEVGEVLHLGPVDLVVEHAWGYSWLDAPMIQVAGTCVLAQDSSPGTINYAMADAAMVGVRVSEDQVYTAERVQMQFGLSHYELAGQQRETPSPGVGPIPCVWEFKMPAGTPIDGQVSAFFWEIEHTDQTNIQTGDDESKTWNRSAEGYRVQLPLEQFIP